MSGKANKLASYMHRFDQDERDADLSASRAGDMIEMIDAAGLTVVDLTCAELLERCAEASWDAYEGRISGVEWSNPAVNGNGFRRARAEAQALAVFGILANDA